MIPAPAPAPIPGPAPMPAPAHTQFQTASTLLPTIRPVKLNVRLRQALEAIRSNSNATNTEPPKNTADWEAVMVPYEEKMRRIIEIAGRGCSGGGGGQSVGGGSGVL
jgi:hypothetical protein